MATQSAIRQRLGTRSIGVAPAPFGGWNTRDSLAVMPPEDAVILDNFFPDVGGVRSRRGHTEFCTGLAGNCETIAEYSSAGTRKMIAAGGGHIYSVADNGTETSLGSGYSNDRWQVIMMNELLLMFNGADTPVEYNGSTLANSTMHGTGLTSSDIIGAHNYRNRLFLWEEDSSHFWYGAASASTGAMVKFDLKYISRLGGTIMAIKSITRDGGNGPDDQLAIFMKSGEVIIYTGTDPGSASDWSIIGRYIIPAPISIRSFLEYKGDVIVITQSDVVSTLQVAIDGGFVNSPSKISGAIKYAAENYSTTYGWAGALYPAGNMLIFNIPITSSISHQYVRNTITGGFARFTGQNARCWGVYKDRIYFGSGTSIFLADEGALDNGGVISVDAQSAYSAVGGRGRKRYAQFRPYVKTEGTVSLTFKIYVDYGTESGTQTTPTNNLSTSPWDTSAWDTTPWSAEEAMRLDVFACSAKGNAISLRIQASLRSQSLEWFQTEYSYIPFARF